MSGMDLPSCKEIGVKIKESRLAIAAILIPIVYALIQYLPPLFFFIFIAAAIARVQYEFYQLFFEGRERAPVYYGLGLGFLLSLRFYQTSLFWNQGLLPFYPVVFILMAIFIYHLFTFREIKTTLVDAAVVLLGIAYIPGFLGYLILLRHLNYGSGLIVFLLLVVWMGDAGAYYVGRLVGKRKLAPAVSPKKTVEGAIGGLAGSALGAAFAKVTFLSFFSWQELLPLALFLAVAGQIGDLTESMLKRSGGVKDSSAIMMAHGGLLDKFDGVAFAAPLFYYYLLWLKGYGRLALGF